MEDAHKVIFARDEELRSARIALTATTATKLVVNTARIMASSADNNKTAEFFDAFAELDIGTTASHVGG